MCRSAAERGGRSLSFVLLRVSSVSLGVGSEARGTEVGLQEGPPGAEPRGLPALRACSSLRGKRFPRISWPCLSIEPLPSPRAEAQTRELARDEWSSLRAASGWCERLAGGRTPGMGESRRGARILMQGQRTRRPRAALTGRERPWLAGPARRRGRWPRPWGGLLGVRRPGHPRCHPAHFPLWDDLHFLPQQPRLPVLPRPLLLQPSPDPGPLLGPLVSRAGPAHSLHQQRRKLSLRGTRG